MWNAFAKWHRLKKAMRMRGLDPDNFTLDGLADVLKKRGIADNVLSPIVWQLINVLEPPACPMSHCRHYGGQRAPMNCGDERLPGRCKILRDYKKRKAALSLNAQSESGDDCDA